jgi:hypothetical protein
LSILARDVVSNPLPDKLSHGAVALISGIPRFHSLLFSRFLAFSALWRRHNDPPIPLKLLNPCGIGKAGRGASEYTDILFRQIIYHLVKAFSIIIPDLPRRAHVMRNEVA